MISFTIEKVHLPLRYAWKLSRNTSYFKENFIIRASDGLCSGLGEVAPNIRYSETPEKVLLEFEVFRKQFEDGISDWTEFLTGIPVCHALKMGLDMAWQRLQAQKQNLSLEEFWGIQPARARTLAYTIPIMEAKEISSFVENEDLKRFSWLKIKVNKESATEMVNAVLNCTSCPVAIDGNEAWTNVEEALNFIQSLPAQRILFIEQPLPSVQKSDYEWLGSHSPIGIWADESVLDCPEPEFWKKSFKGINVKLMKAGSFQKAIILLQTAKELGLQTMIGCMVETTIGISAALALESLADFLDLDGFLLVENEPFHLVKEASGFVSMAKA